MFENTILLPLTFDEQTEQKNMLQPGIEPTDHRLVFRTSALTIELQKHGEHTVSI